MMKAPLHKQAFSLVELSIVLVILGLLTGGVLTGQNLIRAAELRAVTTEFQKYQTAVMTFRDKYFALPGDMRNATDFWGSAGGDGSAHGTCVTQTGTDTETCNGNGDGDIFHIAGAAGEYSERHTFWQHLANAGLIEGSYTGIAGDGAELHVILGENAPNSRLSSAGWTSVYLTSKSVSGVSFFAGNYGNMLAFGNAEPNNYTIGPALNPQEAWGIDKKVDDGKPGTGKVRTRESTGHCHDQASSNSAALADIAAYDLTSTNLECGLLFGPI